MFLLFSFLRRWRWWRRRRLLVFAHVCRRIVDGALWKRWRWRRWWRRWRRCRSRHRWPTTVRARRPHRHSILGSVEVHLLTVQHCRIRHRLRWIVVVVVVVAKQCQWRRWPIIVVVVVSIHVVIKRSRYVREIYNFLTVNDLFDDARRIYRAHAVRAVRRRQQRRG